MANLGSPAAHRSASAIRETTSLLPDTSILVSEGDTEPDLNGTIRQGNSFIRVSRAILARPPGEQVQILSEVNNDLRRRATEYRRNRSFGWFPTEQIEMELPDDSSTRYATSAEGGAIPSDPDIGGDLAAKMGRQSIGDPASPAGIVGSPSKPPTRIRHPNFGLKLEERQHLIVFLGRKKYYVHLPTFFTTLLAIIAAWVFLAVVLGAPMLPGGVVFDTVSTVLVSGLVGGSISLICHVPPMLGILWVAIGWAQINHGVLVHGITHDVTKIFKTFGLTMILLRGGMSVNLTLLKPVIFNATILSLLPLGLEVSIVAVVVRYVLQFDWMWSFVLSTVVAPLSSSVVVTGVLHLQSMARGTYGGPTLLMLSSIPFDSSFGITAATIMIGLATGSGSFALKIGLIPVQLIAGPLVGVAVGWLLVTLLGLLYDARHDGVPETDFQSSVRLRGLVLVVSFSGMILMAAQFASFEGAGALAVVAIGASITRLFSRQGPVGLERRLFLVNDSALIWNLVAMPALFAFVGAKVPLHRFFSMPFFKNGMLVVLGGMGARMLGAAVATIGTDLSYKETIVLCLGWLGKATSQATLANIVMDIALKALNNNLAPCGGGTPEDASSSSGSGSGSGGHSTLAPTTTVAAALNPACDWLDKGRTISDMAVFYVMWAMPIAALSIRKLGKRFVRKDEMNLTVS